jgi:cytochrome b561
MTQTTQQETVDKYPAKLRIIHWATVVAFVFLFITGPIMVDLDKTDPLRADLFGLHKSFGVIAIILLVLRIRVRWNSVLPAFPTSLQSIEISLAYWGHRLIYALLIITPIVGWADSNLHGRPVKLFGLPLPKLFPTLENIGTTPGYIHTILAYSLLTVLSVHIAAVIKHRYIDRVNVLSRIL